MVTMTMTAVTPSVDEVAQQIKERIEELIGSGYELFTVGLSKKEFWDLYLDSFEAEHNPIFRERRVYDCQCCRNFINKMGGTVAIDASLNKTTIWDFELSGDNGRVFNRVFKALHEHVMAQEIVNPLLKSERQIGTPRARDTTRNIVWHHFYCELPSRYVSGRTGSELGRKVERRKLLTRLLDEVPTSVVDRVLDLINSNQVPRGEQWVNTLNNYKNLRVAYLAAKSSQKSDEFVWWFSAKQSEALIRLRNSSIGTLLVDLANEREESIALNRYRQKVSSENYQRSTATYSASMATRALDKVKELGLLRSLNRRLAVPEDVPASNVLWVNANVAPKLKGGAEDVFIELAAAKRKVSIKEGSAQTISIETFLSDHLPLASSVEVLLQRDHARHLSSLIVPEDSEAPSLMAWGNGVSWNYRGNLAGAASMRENVKKAGGRVEGVVQRSSIQWNDQGNNRVDLDNHCYEPNGNHIFFPNKGQVHGSTGRLDVDIVSPGMKVAVENIVWTDLGKMPIGDYVFKVHNFESFNSPNGFTQEIECAGKIHRLRYSRSLSGREYVHTATVTLSADGEFSFKAHIPKDDGEHELWGLPTQQFHPVSLCCLSPNHWGDIPVGQKHYFFFIQGLINPEQPSGFFNEFLPQSLREHRKVLEAVKDKMRVPDKATDHQLTGLGFCKAQGHEVTVRVNGKVLKVQF